MLNNIALQVAIGLVFTYVLYSLLATTIQEFVATIFSYRARMLERGIEQMLDQKNFSYYWWDKVFNWFIWLFGYVRRLTLREFLSPTKLDGATQPLRRKLNKKAALFSNQVTDHPLYRRASINNVFSKKPAYLSSDTFSDILVDILSAGKSSGNSAPALLSDIATAVQNLPDEGLKKILNIYIQQANGDLQRFRLLVEDWYDDTMDRVSGWYKRQTTRILFTIGLVLAVIFNVDTTRIVHALAISPDERTAFVNQASAYIKTHPTIDTTKMDSPATVQAHFNEISDLYKKTLLKGDSVVALGWGDYNKNTTFFSKIGYVLGATFWPKNPAFAWPRLIGFLLTALAISLGAPFWFDLLNKFINLRVSGQKPDGNTAGASKTNKHNQTASRS